MYLNPTEEDRLRIFTAAELARRTLERGLALNAPEATALICDEMHMAARSGASFDEVLEAGRRAVAADQLMRRRGRPDRRDPPRGAPRRGEPARRPSEAVGMSDRIELAPGRDRIRLEVTNTSARVVRVSSHYPFWRTNRRLEFDREAARGFRLDVPAGSSIRFAPGETREVTLVRYGGRGGSDG